MRKKKQKKRVKRIFHEYPSTDVTLENGTVIFYTQKAVRNGEWATIPVMCGSCKETRLVEPIRTIKGFQGLCIKCLPWQKKRVPIKPMSIGVVPQYDRDLERWNKGQDQILSNGSVIYWSKIYMIEKDHAHKRSFIDVMCGKCKTIRKLAPSEVQYLMRGGRFTGYCKQCVRSNETIIASSN